MTMPDLAFDLSQKYEESDLIELIVILLSEHVDLNRTNMEQFCNTMEDDNLEEFIGQLQHCNPN